MAGREPNERVVSAVERGTRGNPLYASEAVRLLSAEGRLEELARSSSGHVAVPPGVRATIGRRLDRLQPETRALVAVGAVVGPEFDGTSSARLPSSTPQPLRTASRRPPRRASCSRSQVRRPAAIGSRTTSSARRSTTSSARGVGSSTIGVPLEVLEARHGSDPEAISPSLRTFFEGQPDGSGDAPAVEYARRAGEEASRSLAFEEAARLYAMALVACSVPGTRTSGSGWTSCSHSAT